MAAQLSDVPFPFPYAQMAVLLMVFHSLVTPVAVALQIPKDEVDVARMWPDVAGSGRI